jgi:prolipoprotein diacylglyceryl transferase
MSATVACAVVMLASIPSPTTAVWHVGPLPVRAYALCIVLGIVAACVVTEVRLRHRGAPPWVILDVAVWAVPFGIIGARIYHLITTPDPYFGSGGHPIEALMIWKGGLGIWGAVSAGALGAWIACRRLGIPLALVADALAPGLPLAQAIGRWGNWFNNELYGRPTGLPWGLKVYQWNPDLGHASMSGGQPLAQPGLYHPTFLYESLWDVGVALLVWLADRRYRFGRGRAFALYVMAYTVGRFWVEGLRDDTAHHILGMRVNSWVSILVFIGALVYFLRVRGPRQVLVTDPDGTLRAVDEGTVEPVHEGSAEPGDDGTAADAEEGERAGPSDGDPDGRAGPDDPDGPGSGAATPADAGPDADTVASRRGTDGPRPAER